MKECDKDLCAHVADPARLAALRAVALLDTPTEESFDRLAWLAARFVQAPVALVTLVDSDRQFFKSCLGLPEPWLSRRQTPLSHSFCQYNRVACKPLLVEDARNHPMFKDNPAIEDLKVVAYLGLPLVTPDGFVLGSFCVIDTEPRHWTEQDVQVVEKLALAVMTEIQLRTEIKTRQETEERLRAEHEETKVLHQTLERESAERLQAVEQLRQRDQILIQQGRLAAIGEMISHIAHQWRQPLNMLALLAQELPMAFKQGLFSLDYLDARVQKMMEIISHMSRTIDDFRNYFRPDTGMMDFDVLEIVEKTLSLMEASLKDADIHLELVAHTRPLAKGFPNQYSQVLFNIIMNAKDAFVARTVNQRTITIETSAEGGRSLVVVRDNAGGIPEEILEKVFDPYFSTKGPESGTGIGLYMSKTIIEKNMGGTLSVRNVDGGAEFRIVV